MTLPSSGPISITDIRSEMGHSSYSLGTLSVDAGKSAPHSMSEFHGFSSAPAFSPINLNFYANSATCNINGNVDTQFIGTWQNNSKQGSWRTEIEWFFDGVSQGVTDYGTTAFTQATFDVYDWPPGPQPDAYFQIRYASGLPGAWATSQLATAGQVTC